MSSRAPSPSSSRARDVAGRGGESCRPCCCCDGVLRAWAQRRVVATVGRGIEYLSDRMRASPNVVEKWTTVMEQAETCRLSRLEVSLMGTSVGGPSAVCSAFLLT